MSKLRKWMMKEERDTNSSGSADLSSSAIKLFGQTIAVADSTSTKGASEEVEQLEGENLKEGEVVNGEDVTVSKKVVVTTSQEDKKEQCSLKKPDKLIPCPRCESIDTKFCYYNNYNINQPRHFCKSCQRYWTAGGTLRNVLVGAGRRKNKYGVQGAGKEDGESQQAVHGVVRIDHHEPAQQPMATVFGTIPPMSLPRHSETSTITSMGPSAFKPLGPEVSSDSVSKLRQRTSDVNKSGDCATSSSETTTTTTPNVATVTPATYVLTPRVAAPEQAAVWTKSAATPLGFFNGAWPYGYNIGWSGTQGPPSAAATALCVPHSGSWTGMCVPTFGWNMLQGGWTLPWRPVPAVGVQMQGPSTSRKRGTASVVTDGDARAGKIVRVASSAGDEPVAAAV